jgi:hypothetical protein
MTAFLALAIAVALFYLGYTRTRGGAVSWREWARPSSPPLLSSSLPSSAPGRPWHWDSEWVRDSSRGSGTRFTDRRPIPSRSPDPPLGRPDPLSGFPRSTSCGALRPAPGIPRRAEGAIGVPSSV